MAALVPAPAATAPNGAPPPAVDDDAAPPPLDPDAEVGEQIKRAKDNVARAERRKAKASKAADKTPAKGKAPAPPEPTPEEIEAGKKKLAELDKPEDDPAAELAAPSASMLVKARTLAEQGDLDGALKLALGKDASAFRINSARWAEWRQATSAERKADADRKGKLEQAAATLRKEFEPLVEARKLFEAEDYEGAFQKAFGLDLNSFQKRAIAKFHGKNPEIEKLRQELAAEREANAKRETEAKQAAAKRDAAVLDQRNINAIAQHLGASDDPQLAALAKKPRFAGQVYAEFQHRVRNGEPASELLLAACAEEIRDGLVGEFGDIFATRDPSVSGRPHQGGQNPESPHQAGKKPARPGTAPAAPSTLSQRGASEASPPGRPLTEEEMFRKYTDKMKHATG